MKGRPLAKAGYEQELISIRGFIAMQNKADSGAAVPAADKVCVCVHVLASWVGSI